MKELISHTIRKGFSIIELLVVMAVATMILSFVLISTRDTKSKSRDITREQHIKTLQNALAIYANSNGDYPIAATETVLTGTDPVSTALITGGAIYQMPTEPLNQVDYVYRYTSANGSTYILRYYLETDSIYGKSAGSNTTSP